MKHVGTGAPQPWRVLVTGFGAFPGARTNPTAAILAHLGQARPRLARLGIDLRCAMLPVVYAEIEPSLTAAALRHRPDAILHLGLAGRRKAISVEIRAVNRAGPLHPDARRQLPRQTLIPGGRASHPATYPAARIAAALQRAGLAARLSRDAGDYVCNATLYRSLASRTAAQVGFIHVPRVRRSHQPSARARTSRPTVPDLTRAVLSAVLVMTRQRVRPAPAATTAAPTGPSTSAAPADRS